MNNYLIAVLAWIGFSPIFGVVIGNFLRRADENAGAYGELEPCQVGVARTSRSMRSPNTAAAPIATGAALNH